MENQALISVIIPVYNVEKYLRECVDSVLNQTYQNFEIILVDDGSTDSSGIICDRYAEEYPEKIRVIHKKNEGLVSARQAGVDSATAEYSLFVDSDDWVENDFLETIYNLLNKHDKTDVVIFTMNYYDGIAYDMFSRSQLAPGSMFYNIYMLNPVTPAINLFRYGFLGTGEVDWLFYGISWITTAVVAIIGALMFSKSEKTFMDTV